MPYNPNAITVDDRGFTMTMMWVGLGSSLLLLTGKIFGFYDHIEALAGGFTAGSLIGLAFIGRQDEYFQSLVYFAARWALSVTGLWLFASIVSFTRDYVDDTVFGLVAIAATFHLAFTWARLRGY